MEAFMYRCHPQIERLVDLLRERAIGDVRVIQATFSFQSDFNPKGRLFNRALGGGGIMDVGCYCASMARLVAGVALGRDIAEPEEVTGTARIGESGVDDWAIASLKFQNGILAQLACGVLLSQENAVRIFGSEGSIVLPTPWGLGSRDNTCIIKLSRRGAEPEEIKVEAPAGLYAMEADTVARDLDRREARFPAMSREDTLGNMATLDRWRKATGLVYPSEEPDTDAGPIHGRPLKIREKNRMKYFRLPGLDKPVSRLLLGTVAGRGAPYGPMMLDHYFELGGNAVDSSYIYGNGSTDRNIGRWMKHRGVREKMVVLVKGAHTPDCNPKALVRQLHISLERLETDHADIYMMHRDNTDIPVGEFMDALNSEVRAGRIRAFGGSNWTPARVDEAQSYASSKSLAGFSAISNNFSLARMVEAPWAGCLASSVPESREWHLRTRMPNIAWSSQAQGFFVVASRENRKNEELVRCWYADDNFARLERAQEMARARGVSATNIALAYVLSQPFPSQAIVGPQTPEETLAILPALDISLSEQDLSWLNLES